MGGKTLVEFDVRVKRGFTELLATCSSHRLAKIVAFLREDVIGTIIDHLKGRQFRVSLPREMGYGASQLIC